MALITTNPISSAETTSPPNPISGCRGLFPTSDGWYDIDSNGNQIKIATQSDVNTLTTKINKTSNELSSTQVEVSAQLEDIKYLYQTDTEAAARLTTLEKNDTAKGKSISALQQDITDIQTEQEEQNETIEVHGEDIETLKVKTDDAEGHINTLYDETGVLRSEMADVSSLASSNERNLAQLKEKSLPHTSAKANYILSITDALANEELRNLKIGSAYDIDEKDKSFMVHIYGKNLIPIENYVAELVKSNGITWTKNTDGTITANGTTTAESTYKFLSGGINTCLPTGTYYISGCPAGGSASTYQIDVALGYSSGSDVVGGVDRGEGLLVNAPNGIKRIYSKIIIAKGVTCDNLTFKPQLEIGNVKTEFEPVKHRDIKVTSGNFPLGDFELATKRIYYGGDYSSATIDGDFVTVDSTVQNIFMDDPYMDSYGYVDEYDSEPWYNIISIEAEYYQDINKVITELKNAVLAQGADV